MIFVSLTNDLKLIEWHDRFKPSYCTTLSSLYEAP